MQLTEIQYIIEKMKDQIETNMSKTIIKKRQRTQIAKKRC